MIVFDNWVIRPEKEILLRQFDNRVTTLKVTGTLPEGWEWVMLVRNGKNMDLLPLERMDGGIGTVLTAERLAVSGSYYLQLRGKQGDVVRHSNMIALYVDASMSGDVQWPQLPAVFSEMDRRVSENTGRTETAKELAEHAAAKAESYTNNPPIIGENGNWWQWDGTQYMDSGRNSVGRSIASGWFNAGKGRWEIVYTDGSTASLAGLDPVDSNIWSIMRDDFERYVPGENTFMEQAAADWRVSSSYPTENTRHDVVEDGNNKYVMMRVLTAEDKAIMISQHLFQGEHTVELDYMPTKQGAVEHGVTTTDFLEVRLFTTDGANIFARVNMKGTNRIYATVPNKKQSPIITDVNGNFYLCEPGVWYRVKVCVRVGSVTMKIWKRDSESEPVGDSCPGAATVALDVLTPEFLAVPHNLRFYFGPHGEAPAIDAGWCMGLDNVKIYRDTKDGIVEKVLAALPVYNGEVVAVTEVEDE